jgi:hypothetical protein
MGRSTGEGHGEAISYLDLGDDKVLPPEHKPVDRD